MSIDEMRAANPDAFIRAQKLTALQKAMYSTFIDLNICDSDIITFLANSLSEMADAAGYTDEQVIQRMAESRQIREFVKSKPQGSVQ